MGMRIAAAVIGVSLLTGCQNDTRLVGIPLSNEAPVAALSGSTEYSPLETALFDGSASYDPDGAIADYEWTIIDRPQGSVANVVPIDGGRRGEFFVDLAGDYTVRLTVTDDGGLSDDETMTFSAIPWQALHVQLSWDTPSTDVDLHLVNEYASGTFCGVPFDCFYGNGNPNWGSFGSSADDPHLDIDDVNGYGPENINLDAPDVMGRYRVMVHYYRDNGIGPSDARIRIYLGGVLKWEGTQLLSQTNRVWNVATIDWATQAVTVNGQLTDSTCSSF